MSMRSTEGAWARMGASVSNASEETSTVIFTNVLIILIQRFCSQVDLNTATAVQSQARQPLYPADDDPAFLAAAVQKYGWGYLSRSTKQGTEWRIASARGKPGHHRERVSGETARVRHYRIDARGTRSPARCVRCGGDPQGGTARDFAWEPAFHAGHTMLAAPLNLPP